MINRSLCLLSCLAMSAIVGAQGAVEVPFRIADDAIIVDVRINGKPASLMFDSGFGGTVILNDTINIGPATGEMSLQDFVGVFDAKTVKVKSLQIGSVNIDPKGKDVVQLPVANLSHSYNTHTDGILGLEAFKGRTFEINFERQKFIFHPDSMDVNKRKPDNEHTFLIKMLPIGMSSIEMFVEAPEGKMVLALDTGNGGYGTTHREVLERIGVWPEDKEPKYMRQSYVASGPVDSWDIKMPPLKIFGVPVETSYWDVIELPSSSAQSDGTIGFGFLKNFNITVDTERRRVWMENFTGTVGNDDTADVGLFANLNERSRRFQILQVSPSSPAAKAGIKEGDEILSIDGVEVRNVGFRRVNKLLQGEPGSKVKLSLSRNGHLMRFELEREFLTNDGQGDTNTSSMPSQKSALLHRASL